MQNYGPQFPVNPNLLGGRYRLGRPLGRGTFGQVYETEDMKFVPPKRVALKLLHAEFINDPKVREDIRREAGQLARFNHPNILRVIDYEVSPNLTYIVTDLAEGGSLANKIMPNPGQPPRQMPLPQVAFYLEQIAGALDEAHTQGLIHRDIKPLNILLDRWDRPLLADFGLAANLGATQTSMVMDGSTSGTPLYMAPEQWRGQAGKASDIYALAVLVYQLITGQPPFQGNQFELMGQHLNEPVPSLAFRAPSLQYPPALDKVMADAMAKNQHERTRPASELARRFKLALTETSAGSELSQPKTPPEVKISDAIPSIQPVPNIPSPQPPKTEEAYAKTQVVSIPSRPIPNPLPNQPPVYPSPSPQPNYVQPQPSYNAPQPYNNYPPNNYVPVNSRAQPYLRPRKTNPWLYIGLGIGALLVLLIIIAAISASQFQTIYYPGAVIQNRTTAIKSQCVEAITADLNISSAGQSCNYYNTADSPDTVMQYYRDTARSKNYNVRQCTVGQNTLCLQISNNSNKQFEMVVDTQDSATNGPTTFVLVSGS